DPYHGPGQAHGLCFSVNEGIAHPPSLINIFKELNTDLDIPYPTSGNLERWAKQGVLLLNATLTVREHEAGSHQKKGWEQFTDAVIAAISENSENVVFLLWGGFAKKKGAKIDTKKHCVLTSGHPSPLSANRGYWFGNKHFSMVNNYLIENELRPVNW
nr:uracil-DNA glycosylase [Lutibacter sp.]